MREQETTIEGPGRGEVTKKGFQEESPRAQSTPYLLPQCAALLPPSTLQSNTPSVRMHQLKLSNRGTLNQYARRHHVLLCPAFLTALYFFFTPNNSNCSLLSSAFKRNPYFSHLVSPFRQETTVGQHQDIWVCLLNRIQINSCSFLHVKIRESYVFKNTCGMPELLSIITEQMAELLVNTEQHLIAKQSDVCLICDLQEKKRLFLYYNSTFSTERTK